MNLEKTTDPAIVRGFDLIFNGVSEQDLNDIAHDLGGESSFNLSEQKATYMFTGDRLMKISQIIDCHNLVNSVGNYFAEKYGCNFEASELYLRVPEQYQFLDKKLCQFIRNHRRC